MGSSFLLYLGFWPVLDRRVFIYESVSMNQLWQIWRMLSIRRAELQGINLIVFQGGKLARILGANFFFW